MSGAAYDLRDLYERQNFMTRYYERRFRGNDDSGQWLSEVSPIRLVHSESPPFFLAYAEGDPDDLKEQAQRMHNALSDAGVPSRLFELPGEDHLRIILAMSRADKEIVPAMVSFIRNSKCEG